MNPFVHNLNYVYSKHNFLLIHFNPLRLPVQREFWSGIYVHFVYNMLQHLAIAGDVIDVRVLEFSVVRKYADLCFKPYLKLQSRNIIFYIITINITFK